MFLACRSVETGIVFALLIGGMFVSNPQSLTAGSELGEKASAVVPQNYVKKLQLALQDRGHYRGKVDGVIGLRTRASIRAFQKAENLPATGQVDPRTARNLGVGPETIRSSSAAARQRPIAGQEQPGNEAVRDKPWAGTRLPKGTRRPPGS
jgi:peptidoglycan hydrolase-like protein with peptidoglycan-binding domain